MTLKARFLLCWGITGTGIYQLDPFPLTGENLTATLVAAVAVYAPIAVLLWLLKPFKRKPAPGSLDQVLFQWTPRDPFTVRDLLTSVAVFGQTGSGKSSGSGLLLARAVTRLPKSGGLILISKPEDKAFWVKRFEEAGRLHDLIVFGEHEPARFNFVDYEMKSGGDSRSLTQLLIVTGESLSKGKGGGENGLFWEQSKKRLLYNAIEPCRQAWGKITIPDLQQFISTAAYSVEQLSDVKPAKGGPSPMEKWLRGFHPRTMEAAAKAKKTAIEVHDFNLCAEYWTHEFITMDNKVRSSVLADVLNVLFTYNSGVVREMVSTTTTVSPADLRRGKWVLCDFPLDRYDDSGRIIMHGWKYLVQRDLLRREAKEGDSVVVIHADEAQEMVSSFDAAFLAKCRSHLACMIYLTQSLHSYYGDGQ